MDVSKWIYGFLERKRREQREGASSKRDRYIYLRLRSNKHVQPPPPLITTTKWCFFSRPRILLSKKQNKKTKKKQKSWWTCNTNLYFSTHARTRTRVNMSSAVSDSARVVRLFISSLFVRALRARERALSAEEELCNVVPDDPPGWILSLSMGLSPSSSSSSAIRSRPDMS